jgi:hypothetical protein
MSATRLLSYRPQLEGLEERLVLNASRVWDAAGNLYYFVNYANGGLYRYDATGVSFLGGGVRSVHAFRDAQGLLGFDVVFDTGPTPSGVNAPEVGIEYDATGSHYISSGLVSAATSYDNLGRKTVDLVFDPELQSGAGYYSDWYEYDDASPNGRLMGHNQSHVETTFDAAGNKAIDVVYKTFASQSGYAIYDEWVVYDASGSHDEGGGGPAAFTPGGFIYFSSTGITSVERALTPSGQTIIDIVYRDGRWAYFDDAGMHEFGGFGLVR